MHAPAHTCMINMAASMGAAICNFYTCIFLHYTHAYMCMCMHVGAPQTYPHPPLHLQEPGGQIIKYTIKLE